MDSEGDKFNMIIWLKSTIHVILQIKFPLSLLNCHHPIIYFNLKFRKKKGKIIILKFHFLIDLFDVSLRKVNKSKKMKHIVDETKIVIVQRHELILCEIT